MNHEPFPMQTTCTEQQAQKVVEILTGEDFLPKLLWRTPTKIHRERDKTTITRNREAERTSLSTVKAMQAMSLTQTLQTCTEAATKSIYTTITLQTIPLREHRLPTLQKGMRRSVSV